MIRHLLSTGDLSRDDANLILDTAEEMPSLVERVKVSVEDTDGVDAVTIEGVLGEK